MQGHREEATAPLAHRGKRAAIPKEERTIVLLFCHAHGQKPQGTKRIHVPWTIIFLLHRGF